MVAQSGGTALYTRFPIEITNHGVIGGGGGAGGYSVVYKELGYGYVAGGGGGAGKVEGTGGYAYGPDYVDSGDNGTLENGGAGGVAAFVLGGAGGDLGENGGDGTGGAVNQEGGTCGRAIDGDGYVTIDSSSTGTISGLDADEIVLNNVYEVTNAAADTGWADITSDAITLPAGVKRLTVTAQAYGCTAESYDVYTGDKEPVYDHTETAWYQATFNMKLQYYTNSGWVTATQAAPVVAGSAPQVLLDFFFDTGTIATDIEQYRLVFDYVSDYYDTNPYVVQEVVDGTFEYLKEVSYSY